MKIAYVYDVIHPYVAGGVQKRIWEVSRRLARRGHQVTIFGMKHWQGEDTLCSEGVRLWGVCPPQPLFVNGRRSVKESLYFAWRVLPPLLREPFDVVDCQNFPYFPCFSAAFHSVARRSRLIITWHEVWDNYWYDYLGRSGFFGRLVERAIARMPSINATSTLHNKGRLTAIGARESRIRVVPIGGVSLADVDKIPPSIERTDLIFVGRLTRPKGVDTLLRSIARLKANSIVAASTIIGDGPERSNLESLARDLGIHEQVSFLGRVEDDARVISLMKSAKVFVYPAMPEGTWSVSVIEANACGVPAVSVRAGKLGMNEVVTDGFNGLLVAEQSAEAIADKLSLLLQHESMRAELARNALAFAREQDWDVVAEKADILYCEAMRAGQERSASSE
jgi:glycosyltransferase involved in cell wall biosynthesis